MDLIDYLIALDGGNRAAPDKLTLPEKFAGELGKLYTTSESKGLEHGRTLFCDRASRAHSYGDVAHGLPTSMNIPVSAHVNNFGNVHAHPSASIGHVGGHSAHSMMDLAKFADTRDRPYFFQFVASGPRTYAMVQVRGVSLWDDTVGPFLTKRNAEEEGEMLVAARKAAGGDSTFDMRKSTYVNNDDEAGYEAWLTQLKTQANVGSLMQTLSMQNCAAFARQYHYFFFSGEGGLLTGAY